MKQLRYITNLVLMGFALLIGIMSIKLGIGTLSNMGPGFAALLMCALLFLTTSYLLILELRTGRDSEKKVIDKDTLFKPIALCLIIVGYIFLLNIVGYPFTSFLVVFGASSLAASRRWITNAVFAAITVAVTYSLFKFFGLVLPMGILSIKGWG